MTVPVARTTDTRAEWTMNNERGTGVLLLPADWTRTEHRALRSMFRALGWEIVRMRDFHADSGSGRSDVCLLRRRSLRVVSHDAAA